MAYIYDLSDTWNAGGTTFYGIKMNVTATAYAAGSRLISVQVSGSEKFEVDVNGNGDFVGTKVRIRTSSTPASAGANGSAGDICWDSSYIYVCVATNTWKRAALATW